MAILMRTVEYYRCWEDRTWDTDYIEIPADTPEDKLEDAVDEAVESILWDKEAPVLTGLYYAGNEGETALDPNACLQRLLDALGDNDLGEASHAGKDLQEWIRRGGFRPKITEDQAQKLLNYVLDSALILGTPE